MDELQPATTHENSGHWSHVGRAAAPPIQLLLVDRDRAFRQLCSEKLRRVGIDPVVVGSSARAQRMLATDTTEFDLVVLDMDLPGAGGLELLALLRDRGVPVVAVSAVDCVESRVYALHHGADDCVVKPCAFEELLARLMTVLRRSARPGALRFGDLELDPALRRTHSGGRPVDLAPREFALLRVLVSARGGVVASAELIRRVWSLDLAAGTNTLRVNVSRLKRKLSLHSRVLVEAFDGTGYRLVDGGA